MHKKLYVLALAGQPSLHGYDACMIYWTKAALRRNRRQKYGETSFSPFLVFLLRVGILGYVFGAWFFGIFGLGGPDTLGHPRLVSFFGLEVFNVGGWLTHCDFALEAQVDFLAVVEHRLIPARARSECDRLRRKALAFLWAPASQDSSHVGNAGVGVASLTGAPVSLPTFATAQFK